MSKLGMVRTSSAGGGLGPQMSMFNSMRSMSRKGNSGGNPLTRESSGQSSRTATPGVATPLSAISSNSFEYVFCSDLANSSIFRNEAEKDDDGMPAPASRPESVIVPDAEEVADGGYYTVPPIKTVASTASVSNFVVVRKGYGSVSFKGVVDLVSITSLSVLRDYVVINRGSVTVYPNEETKPPAGEGLNVSAEVLLEKCFPAPDVSVDSYIHTLKATPDTNFVSYDAETGTWVFTVGHFSSYSVDVEGGDWQTESRVSTFISPSPSRHVFPEASIQSSRISTSQLSSPRLTRSTSRVDRSILLPAKEPILSSRQSGYD
jgi:hypothetical protein